MIPPDGVEALENEVLKLNKAIYGLLQAEKFFEDICELSEEH